MVEIGAGWDGKAYVAAVEESGIPSYVGLSHRNASMCFKPNGSTGYLWEDVAEMACWPSEFAERCHEGELPRFCPVLYPGHPHNCELAVFERTAEIAWDRSWAGDLLSLAHEDGSSTWDDVHNWCPGGGSVDEIVIPAYPMR